MACSLFVEIKNKQGETVTSNLFSDLTSVVDRQTAKVVYTVALNKQFQENYADELEYDNNGEPTIASIDKILKLD